MDYGWRREHVRNSADPQLEQYIRHAVQMYVYRNEAASKAGLTPAPFVWAAAKNLPETMQRLLEEQSDELPNYE
jgi:hypothetical protein